MFHAAGIGWLPDGRMLVVAPTEDKQVIEVGPDGNRIYADLSDLAPGWANDMLVDQQGRAYVGNFGYDLFTEEPRPTHLLLVRPDGTVERQSDEILFPNGTVRRSDGTLVVSESFAHEVAIFDVADHGSTTLVRRVHIDDDVVPDGMCIDAEDGVWFGTLTNDVIRLGADGLIERVTMSAPTFACMLGGADRRTLYVATSPDYDPAARRQHTESRIGLYGCPSPEPVSTGSTPDPASTEPTSRSEFSLTKSVAARPSAAAGSTINPEQR